MDNDQLEVEREAEFSEVDNGKKSQLERKRRTPWIEGSDNPGTPGTRNSIPELKSDREREGVV
jgi:hypothetical protein